eukprot:gnl/MRDRNA2_/MRDRNA2_66413_c0_seq1.p1 gnl/MRDRNA2_/MRDRNA2_66413_c0~~gnl/MRDRNA2_/MRDRNA2_66413_c0_seq1.p1  ORF type:complete len:133 (-),score=16.90 gnl/MRDRNA2_/MRDRNA2_66413_c0_seq1:114-512(-)
MGSVGLKKKDEVHDFDQRAVRCQVQAQQFKILPLKSASTAEQESGMAFCRCRTAVFDWLRWMPRWIMVVWFFDLMGVCAVMYVSAKPKLLRMSSKERTELVAIWGLGIAVLVAKVTVLSDRPSKNRRPPVSY